MRMKRLLYDRSGSAYLWAAFIVLALIMLAAVVYNGVMVYAKYQTVETELQRAATVTVDRSMRNEAIRDLILDVPADAEEILLDQLRELGYKQRGSDWVKRFSGKTVYTLEDMKIEVDGRAVKVTAMLAIPLLWETGGAPVVRIPIQVQASVLYIE